MKISDTTAGRGHIGIVALVAAAIWIQGAAAQEPAVANLPTASMARDTWARLSVSNGVAGSEVRVFVSTNPDLGETLTGWDVTNTVASAPVGRSTVTIDGLDPETPYYWRSFATNASGSAWSATTNTFTTLAAPDARLPPVTNGLALHLAADDIAGYANNEYVHVWLDASGSDLDFERDSVSQRPQYKSAVALLGNMPAIYCDAGDHPGLAGSVPVIDLNHNRTVAMVVVPDGKDTDGCEVFGTGTGAMIDLNASRVRVRNGSPNLYTEPTDSSLLHNQAHIIIVTDDAADATPTHVYIDGSAPSVSYVSGDATVRYFGWTMDAVVGLGFCVSGSQRDYKGYVAELLLYDDVLTSEEQNAVGYHLEQKYGLDTGYVAPGQRAGVENLPKIAMWRDTWARLSIDNAVANSEVRVLVSTNDALGEVLTGWDATATLPTASYGRSTVTLSGLLPNKTYYWRSFASNEFGVGWSSTTNMFTTLASPGVLEPPVTSGLILQLEASDIRNYADNEYVEAWLDASGNDLDFDRDEASLRPQYKAGVALLGGRPAIYCDDTRRGLDGTVPAIGADHDRTIALVVVPTKTATVGCEVFGTDSGQMIDLGPARVRARNGSNLYTEPQGSSLSRDEPHIVVVTDGPADPRATHVYIDGVEPSVSYDGAESARYFGWSMDASLELGYSSLTTAERHYKGYIAEVLLYDHVLSEREHATLGYHLEQKYGLDTAYESVARGTIVILR